MSTELRKRMERNIKFVNDAAAVKAERDTFKSKADLYEHEYILPLFKRAKELGFDLQQLVLDNPGKNCVTLFVEKLEAENTRLREALTQVIHLATNGDESKLDVPYQPTEGDWVRLVKQSQAALAAGKGEKE